MIHNRIFIKDNWHKKGKSIVITSDTTTTIPDRLIVFIEATGAEKQKNSRLHTLQQGGAEVL